MRRRKAQEKVVLPDPKFNSKIVAKFINMVMLKGKKSVAEKMVYGAFEIVKKNLNEPDVIKIFHKALDNARPRLEVKPRRVGGATYKVPIEVRQERGTSIALRWIRDFDKTKKGKHMPDKLAEEIISAYKGEGSAILCVSSLFFMAEPSPLYAEMISSANLSGMGLPFFVLAKSLIQRKAIEVPRSCLTSIEIGRAHV